MSTSALLSVSSYTNAQNFHTEKQSIFRKNWLLAAHLSQLPLHKQLAQTIAGVPVLLWHTENGIKAFANICRHRGAPLAWEDAPQTGKLLRCRYHGWTYNSDGLLVNNTDFGDPCEQLHLHTLCLTIVKDWIFVAWEQPKESPQELFPTLFSQLPCDQNWTIRSTAQHTLQCNWKVYVENYLEGYHIPYLHPSLSKEISMSSYKIIVRKKEIEHKVTTKEQTKNDGYWAYCWPNLAMNIYQNGLSIERILPISVNETIIAYWYLFPEHTSEDQVQQSESISAEITKEDIQIVEAIHQNMNSGLYEPGPLSPKHEHGIQSFQQWVCESLND